MRLAACLAAALALTGCQTVRDTLGSPEPNPGPCPNALSLYDAHRLVEIEGDDPVFENVGFTGEILDVASRCRYTDRQASPIDVSMAIRFAFGRGPAAEGREHTYNYFVTVTRRDTAVIDKQVFPITVRFDRDEDRVLVTEEFDSIRIPRAEADTSGANFEIIVGFELTDEQLEFNRSGLRFRVDAGQGG
ncbi:hypothetical protein DDZ18_08295 [Marinicauda salina]|jgi:hypothetical protein|uniref:Lipoprotein n=1 Tax=Marinicauda salina TaxID=2135793 RepID=A0A2U2BUI7_9PROT|nr:hypothetical protein [Marinicauda salina]PWE17649.1 hypothetical protein DDZ18_08295 [Marinicauda salina]